MPILTYDIGYYGKVVINQVNILSTGGNVSLQYSPIFTSGVWGANVRNATQKIAYAPNYVSMSANSNFQLTPKVVETISDFAFLQRQEKRSIEILPNGIAGYSGNGYCISCSFSASQDSLVSGNIGLKTGDVKNSIKNQKIDETSSERGPNISKYQINEIDDVIGPDYLDVYPYWASGVYLKKVKSENDQNSDQQTRIKPGQQVFVNKDLIQDIMDWDVSYNSELVLGAYCSGTNEMLQADYCALGTMQAEGSFTMFRIGSHFNPKEIQDHNTCKVKMKTAYDAKKRTSENDAEVQYGAIIWTSASTDVQTGSSFIQSSFSFTALGNDQQGPMVFKKSKND